MIPETVRVLDALHGVMRAQGAPDAEQGRAHSALGELTTALLEARPPFSLQFVEDGVFRGGRQLPLDYDGYRRCQQLALSLRKLGAGEIELGDVPSDATLIALCRLLREASLGKAGPERRDEVGGDVELRPLPMLRIGVEGNPLENEIFADLQLRRATDRTGLLMTREQAAWSWEDGLSIVRCLEQVLAADPTAAVRSLELGGAGWTRSRRAVAAGVHVGSVLVGLSASSASRRAAIHAALMLAVHGYEQREGAAIFDAAHAAFEAAVAARPRRPGASDPHRLRVATLLAEVRAGDPARMPLTGLLRLAYDLELRRCPRGCSFELSRVDQLAWVVSELGRAVDWRWGRAFLRALGSPAAGAFATVDGCLALVFDGDESSTPKVLLAGEVKQVEQPVSLHSAIGMTPWDKRKRSPR